MSNSNTTKHTFKKHTESTPVRNKTTRTCKDSSYTKNSTRSNCSVDGV